MLVLIGTIKLLLIRHMKLNSINVAGKWVLAQEPKCMQPSTVAWNQLLPDSSCHMGSCIGSCSPSKSYAAA
jgi:hypothetical protein